MTQIASKMQIRRKLLRQYRGVLPVSGIEFIGLKSKRADGVAVCDNGRHRKCQPLCVFLFYNAVNAGMPFLSFVPSPA
jgi:hypothetical protein